MRTLGLDLGTNSIGWALVTDSDDAGPTIQAGVYVFPEAGELEGGLFESHRHKRGEKRRQRRNLRRKRQRRDSLQRILVESGLLPADADTRRELFCAHVDSQGVDCHPYALRKRGLDAPLTLHEFGRALFHIGRRRGYLSTALLKLRRTQWAHTGAPEPQAGADDTAEETGTAAEKKAREEERGMLAEIGRLRKRLEAGEARTIGEFYADRLAERQPVRGASKEKADARKKRGCAEPAGFRAERAMFEEEFDRLWTAQAAFHPGVLTVPLRARIYAAIFDQRPLRPAAHLVRTCEFFPRRRCAARASLLFQRVHVLQYLTTLELQSPGCRPRRLTGPEVSILADALEATDHITWRMARDIIGAPDARFSDEPARAASGRGKQGGAVRGKQFIRGNRTAAVLRKAIGSTWDDLPCGVQEDLVTRLLTCREFWHIAHRLGGDFGLNADQVAALAVAELPDGYGSHCTRVLRALEPHLRQGLHYYEACVKAGFRQANESTVPTVERPVDRLPALPDLRNPTVQRSAEAARRVINAVIDRYGKPDRIRIELPREVSRTNKQREDDWRRQDENYRKREAARKLLEEADLLVGRVDRNITKVLLWQEAGGASPYEPDRPISLTELVNDCDIDHIVPRSRCYDNSYGNLTIAPFHLNLAKGNLTPFEAWGHTERWPAIAAGVSHMHGMHPAKRRRILSETCDLEEFTNRALTDTSYISKVVANAVRALGVEVQPSRGRITALLREAWELGGALPPREEEKAALEAWREQRVKKVPKPRHDHRHHAVDAIVTAVVDRSTLQAVSGWLKEQERGMQRNTLPKPVPWPGFAADVAAAVQACPVVFEPTRGIGGPLHKETARKPPPADDVRRALDALPPDRRGRVRRCVRVGSQLVWLEPDGTPARAYDLGSNHHATVWERDGKDGKPERDLTVTSMLEASDRALTGRPVFEREREGWRYVMALCQNDVVEWTGEGAGLWRVAKSSCGANGAFELVLAPLADARATRERRLRLQSRGWLNDIRRRVALSPLGGIVAQEPPEA